VANLDGKAQGDAKKGRYIVRQESKDEHVYTKKDKKNTNN